MTAVSVHEAAYAHAIEGERPLLQATAFLLSGDRVRAERLVQLVLAQLYERWPHVQRPQIEALRALIRADRRDAHLPWEAARRFELVECAGIDQHARGPPAGIMRALRCGASSMHRKHCSGWIDLLAH